MHMTDKQIYTYLGEAAAYTDRAAFASDVAISVYDAAENTEDVSAEFAEQVARLWDVAHLSFGELLKAFGLGQTECSRRFCIPLRTVQHWCASGAEARSCTTYLRLMMAELIGYIHLRA